MAKYPHSKAGKRQIEHTLATIRITEDGQTVYVSNGDRVIVDIPNGGTVNIVAENPNVRNFRVDYADNDVAGSRVIVDFDSFQRDDLQVLVSGYDPQDTISLDGAKNIQLGTPQENMASYEYGDGFSGTIKILDPRERDLTDKPPPIVICFANGTIIDTELGPCKVESILVGDRVKTVDNGNQPVQWIGSRKLDALDLLRSPHLLPIRISAGALGDGLPLIELIVSPQHRVCLRDWRADILFGHSEVLVAAKALVGFPGIDVCRDWTGSYHHLLFERHELIWSNGLITESLHPGEVAFSALGEQDKKNAANTI